MTKPKPRAATPVAPPSAAPDIPAHELLARAVGVKPGDLADLFQRTQEQADVVFRSADERRERLRAAVRDPAKRFRL